MSERKVLNKYYPPDFDPSKIPKLHLARNRQYSIRIMAPFNMRCNTCGEYIYKGKKFNSRKETVEDEDYLGLKIFRFYIKCPRCVGEIAFKTDPQNTDYSLEAGATRNFEASKTAELLAVQAQKEKEAEEANNPMKVLENRTKASRQEMEMLETLEELRELNSRHAKVDHESMIKVYREYEKQLAKLQDEEDERFVQSVFGKTGDTVVKRLRDDEDEDCSGQPLVKKLAKEEKPTDLLTSETSQKKQSKKPAVWEKSVGGLSSRNKLGLLVKKKSHNKETLTQKTEVVPDNGLSKTTTSGPVVKKISSKNDAIAVKGTAEGSAIVQNGGQHQSVPKVNTLVGKCNGDSEEKTLQVSVTPSGIGLLGNYSDTDEDSD